MNIYYLFRTKGNINPFETSVQLQSLSLNCQVSSHTSSLYKRISSHLNCSYLMSMLVLWAYLKPSSCHIRHIRSQHSAVGSIGPQRIQYIGACCHIDWSFCNTVRNYKTAQRVNGYSNNSNNDNNSSSNSSISRDDSPAEELSELFVGSIWFVIASN